MQTDALIPESSIVGDDEDDTRLLRELASRARNYVGSFHWSVPVKDLYLGVGIGGVVAVFLIHFTKPVAETDEYLWVVVGDVPSAYFVTDDAPDPLSALHVYCELMDDWVKAVRGGTVGEDVFPVEAPEDEEHAAMLEQGLAFIRGKLLPQFQEVWRERRNGNQSGAEPLRPD